MLSGEYDLDSKDSDLEQEKKKKKKKKRCWKEGDDAVDATVVLTADHGHVTVQPKDMVVLPSSILELLEYACIGVQGKGRH